MLGICWGLGEFVRVFEGFSVTLMIQGNFLEEKLKKISGIFKLNPTFGVSGWK